MWIDKKNLFVWLREKKKKWRRRRRRRKQVARTAPKRKKKINKKGKNNLHMGILVNSNWAFLPLSFLPILGRKHFGGPGEKISRPHQFFFLPPFNQTTT